MLFNSWEFAAFFVIVLALYYALAHRYQNLLLLGASYTFYAAWDWRFLALLWTSTVVDFVAAQSIARTDQKRQRRIWLGISLATNLGILGFFKYFNFFVGSASDALNLIGLEANVAVLQLVLPVGISFYTFQTLAYTIDVYRGQQEPTRDWLSFALYVSYFPQLVAGPIERAKRLLPQIEAPRRVNDEDVSIGVQLLLWGYVKKVVIGDSLARYVDAVYAAPGEMDRMTLWLGMYAFSIQLYCDFSGYSDIARGASRLMGIKLMENFRQPFLAPNITEFWRRWHVSLSTWLRDYLYIPLGGNRVSTVRQHVNLWITFILGGLWHGANWTFVAWGALNAIFLSVHRVFQGGQSVAARHDPTRLREWCAFLPSILITFHLAAAAFVVFRCASIAEASTYLWGMMFSDASLSTFAYTQQFDGFAMTLLVHMVVVFCIDAGCRRSGTEVPCTPRMTAWSRGLVYAAALLMLVFVRDAYVEPFFYFQF